MPLHQVALFNTPNNGGGSSSKKVEMENDPEMVETEFIRGNFQNFWKFDIQDTFVSFKASPKVRSKYDDNYVIDPDKSTFKLYWDILIYLFILYTILIVPFRIGFNLVPSVGSITIDILIDIFYFFDIIINFNTGFRDDESDELIKSRKKIAMNYLTSWFLFDALSVIPFDYFMRDSTSLFAVRAIRTFRLFKLFKLYRFSQLSEYFSAQMNPMIISLGGLMFQILVIAHLFACFWHFLGSNDNRDSTRWLDPYENESNTDRYITSFYYIIVTMLTVGYGDIHPTNNYERIFAIITMLVGTIVFGTLVSKVARLIHLRNPQARLYKERMDELKSFLDMKSLKDKEPVKRRIKDAYSYYLSNCSLLLQSSVLDELPDLYLDSIIQKLFKKQIGLFTNVFYPSLNGKYSKCIGDILRKTKPWQAIRGETIYNHGDVCQELSVLIHGKIYMVASSKLFGDHIKLVRVDSLKSEEGKDLAGEHTDKTVGSINNDSSGNGNVSINISNRFPFMGFGRTNSKQQQPPPTVMLTKADDEDPNSSHHSNSNTPRGTLALHMDRVIVGQIKFKNEKTPFFGDFEYLNGPICEVSYVVENNCNMLTISHKALTAIMNTHYEMKEEFDKSIKERYELFQAVVSDIQIRNLETIRIDGRKYNFNYQIWAGTECVEFKSKSKLSLFQKMQRVSRQFIASFKGNEVEEDDQTIKSDNIFKSASIDDEEAEKQFRMTRFKTVGGREYHIERKDIEKEISENTDNLRDTFHRKQTIVSMHSPHIMITASMKKKWVIYPNNPYKLYWDVIMAGWILVSTLVIPVQVAFDQPTTEGSFALDLVLDIFFFLDIILSFYTARTNDKTTFGSVFNDYVYSWRFLIDVASCFPFNEIIYLSSLGRDTNAVRSARIIKLLRLFRLLKIFQLMKLSQVMDKLEYKLGVSTVAVSIFKLIVEVFIVGHFVACIWWGMSTIMTDVTWFNKMGSDDDGFFGFDLATKPVGYRYLVSLYYTFTTMTSVGYGDIYPVNPPERVIATLIVITGASVFGYIFANVSALLDKYNVAQSQKNEKIAEISEYLKEQNIESAEIIDYYKNLFLFKSVVSENQIYAGLPPMLADKLLINQHHSIFENIRLFDKNIGIKQDSIRVYIYRLMKPNFVMLDREIIQEGDEGTKIVFIVKGRAQAKRIADKSRSITIPIPKTETYDDGDHYYRKSLNEQDDISPNKYDSFKLAEDRWATRKRSISKFVGGFFHTTGKFQHDDSINNNSNNNDNDNNNGIEMEMPSLRKNSTTKNDNNNTLSYNKLQSDENKDDNEITDRSIEIDISRDTSIQLDAVYQHQTSSAFDQGNMMNNNNFILNNDNSIKHSNSVNNTATGKGENSIKTRNTESRMSVDTDNIESARMNHVTRDESINNNNNDQSERKKAVKWRSFLFPSAQQQNSVVDEQVDDEYEGNNNNNSHSKNATKVHGGHIKPESHHHSTTNDNNTLDLLPGSFFGHKELFYNLVHEAPVIAKSNVCIVFELSKQELHLLQSKNTEIAKSIRTTLENLIKADEEKGKSNHTSNEGKEEESIILNLPQTTTNQHVNNIDVYNDSPEMKDDDATTRKTIQDHLKDEDM